MYCIIVKLLCFVDAIILQQLKIQLNVFNTLIISKINTNYYVKIV